MRIDKRILFPVVLIVLLLLVWILSSNPEDTTGQHTQFMMDTIVEIRAIGTNPEDAIAKAFAEIARVEQLFSRYLPSSDVSKINEQAGEWVTVSHETIKVIEQGITYGIATNGAFDITIGSLVTLWGFGTSTQRVPSQAELDITIALVDFRAVEVNHNSNQVRIPEGSMLDLGGIAKGYAVDQAAQVLRANRISKGLINAGGDIATIGTRPDGNPWRVGIQDARDTTAVLAVVPLTNSTVVTSGDYQRFFVEDNVNFHHIIDPKTGYPARGVISVTVVADTALVGDIFSTAIFVLGNDQGQALVEATSGLEAIIVDEAGEIWTSSGLNRDQLFQK